ncbi:histidine phosphatase family protein [Pseudarthrobacter sp. J75]|uniref:SixA phosphatase family protein n=1 Tax=unclassified Pseudarthrobacter TaxID=2647000 RepID=UPI002E80575A|nr:MULTISPECIES: histidine phosphatase family protein [unclassified Pseudarthrobacter]MEE2522501.1 histidine phosphatase family protein [Pseudarthrobacter sp. J47]MEE2529168.1 histidine phosphatase family protein [Pseudarthrobacter sp. J75]
MSEHHIRRLILMRHSKADWPGGVDDHDRPLEERGHREAPLAGRWLVDHQVVPDFILCSSALRTRQTCTWVCSELGDKAPTPKLESGLYAASALRMLTVINQVPETVTTLMVIAHLPGVQDLAMHLASRDSDHDAYMDAATKYPTSALSVLETEKPWAELDGQDAVLTRFAVPRSK